MASRELTKDELHKVIYNSLTTIWNFGVKHNDPNFPKEQIDWKAILAIEPVTKTYLYNHTLVATYALNPGRLIPTMNQKKYFGHLDTSRETVAQYRDFLQPWLLVKEV